MGKSRERESESAEIDNYKEEMIEKKEQIKMLLFDCGVNDKKVKLLDPIIENAAWMNIKLDETREKIKTSGAVIRYDNGGGQSGIRENPYYKAYESLFKAYMSAMCKILDCLPKEQIEDAIEVEKPKSVLELVRDKHKKEA